MSPKKARTKPKTPRRRISTGGGLDYALGQIDAQLVIVQQVLSEDRLSSAQYRTHIRETLNNQQEKLTHMEGQMDHMSSTLTEVKDNMRAIDLRVESLESKNNERTGFTKALELMGKLAYVVAGGVGGLMGVIADRYLRGGVPPHHP